MNYLLLIIKWLMLCLLYCRFWLKVGLLYSRLCVKVGWIGCRFVWICCKYVRLYCRWGWLYCRYGMKTGLLYCRYVAVVLLLDLLQLVNFIAGTNFNIVIDVDDTQDTDEDLLDEDTADGYVPLEQLPADDGRDEEEQHVSAKDAADGYMPLKQLSEEEGRGEEEQQHVSAKDAADGYVPLEQLLADEGRDEDEQQQGSAKDTADGYVPLKQLQADEGRGEDEQQHVSAKDAADGYVPLEQLLADEGRDEDEQQQGPAKEEGDWAFLFLLAFFYIILLLLLQPASVLAAEPDYSSSVLKSESEKKLRSSKERKTRLEVNELLDDNSRFYYDGNDVYPALVLDKFIFPAVFDGKSRRPGCIMAGEVIPGSYDKSSKTVICKLSNIHQQGKSIILSDNRTVSQLPGSAEGTGTARTKGVVADSEQESKKKRGAKSVAKSTPVAESKPGKSGKSAAESTPVAKLKPGKPAKSKAASTATRINSEALPVLEVNSFKTPKKFGVRAGTWARIRLPRSVSSSEVAEIEFELLEEIRGINRAIPIGTIFFAKHRVNPSTQRLDLRVGLMVLPDGEEYQVSATVHGKNRAAGLAGSIITHTDKIARLAARKSLINELSAEVSQLSNPAGRVTGGIADEVLGAQRDSLPVSPSYSVQVMAQESLLRFERSF